MSANQLPLQPVPGFEATDYRLLHGRMVWVGRSEDVTHPLNLHAPWQAVPRTYDAERLRAGAHALLADWQPMTAPQLKGLMLWRLGHPLPFPLQRAASRFDAIDRALRTGDVLALEQSCLRVLGLGPGLTPSGDDFVGGLMFALHHAPLPAWVDHMADLHHRIQAAATAATNRISAALLDHLMGGCSHRAAHHLLDALEAQDAIQIGSSCNELEGIGSTSGFDILAGMLTALTSPCTP